MGVCAEWGLPHLHHHPPCGEAGFAEGEHAPASIFSDRKARRSVWFCWKVNSRPRGEGAGSSARTGGCGLPARQGRTKPRSRAGPENPGQPTLGPASANRKERSGGQRSSVRLRREPRRALGHEPHSPRRAGDGGHTKQQPIWLGACCRRCRPSRPGPRPSTHRGLDGPGRLLGVTAVQQEETPHTQTAASSVAGISLSAAMNSADAARYASRSKGRNTASGQRGAGRTQRRCRNALRTPWPGLAACRVTVATHRTGRPRNRAAGRVRPRRSTGRDPHAGRRVPHTKPALISR